MAFWAAQEIARLRAALQVIARFVDRNNIMEPSDEAEIAYEALHPEGVT